MKTKPIAIVTIILCTIFTTAGQLFLKMGVNNNFSFEIISLITNFPLIFGFISYALGGLLLIYSLRHGELSVIYPFIALSFIWVSLLSIFILKESMSITNWLGVFIIIIGVSLIGKGGKSG